MGVPVSWQIGLDNSFAKSAFLIRSFIFSFAKSSVSSDSFNSSRTSSGSSVAVFLYNSTKSLIKSILTPHV